MNSTVSMVLLYAVMIGALWFFVFRPQKKQRQQLKEMRDSLSVGDKVVTIGGLVGTITYINNEEVRIKCSAGEPINFKRSAIASKENQGVEAVN